MKLHLFLFYLAVFLFFSITSCTPDIFYLKQSFIIPISCLITGNTDNVKKIADNAVRIKDSGRVSFRKIGLTQFIGDFTVELTSGEGIRFYLRSADYQFDKHKTLCFEFLNKKCIFKENNKVLFETDTIYAEYNRQSRIKITEDGKKLKLSIDCTDIIIENKNIPASEYIIIESAGGGEAIITGIDLEFLYE